MYGTAPKKYFFLAVINLSKTDGVGNKRIEIFETKTRNSYLLLRGNGRQFSTQGNQNGRVLEDKLAKQSINYVINRHAHENARECFRTSF